MSEIEAALKTLETLIITDKTQNIASDDSNDNFIDDENFIYEFSEDLMILMKIQLEKIFSLKKMRKK